MSIGDATFNIGGATATTKVYKDTPLELLIVLSL